MVDPGRRGTTAPILIEATFKGIACLSSVYMEAAVQEILPAFGGRVAYERIEITSAPGKQRFLELSCQLYGETAVYTHHRLAPLPGLFVDGKLCFDTIPTQDALEAAIQARLP